MLHEYFSYHHHYGKAQLEAICCLRLSIPYSYAKHLNVYFDSYFRATFAVRIQLFFGLADPGRSVGISWHWGRSAGYARGFDYVSRALEQVPDNWRPTAY